MDLENRAIRFANNVKHLNRFLVPDPVVEGLYGYRTYVLSETKLRTYYERHEPNPAWRNYPAFRNQMQSRVELHLGSGG